MPSSSKSPTPSNSPHKWCPWMWTGPLPWIRRKITGASGNSKNDCEKRFSPTFNTAIGILTVSSLAFVSTWRKSNEIVRNCRNKTRLEVKVNRKLTSTTLYSSAFASTPRRICLTINLLARSGYSSASSFSSGFHVTTAFSPFSVAPETILWNNQHFVKPHGSCSKAPGLSHF